MRHTNVKAEQGAVGAVGKKIKISGYLGRAGELYPELVSMAAWRIRKHLKKEPVLLESFLFQNCARGLRPSDWRELIDKLCSGGVLVRGLSKGHGKPTLSFAQPQAAQELTNGQMIELRDQITALFRPTEEPKEPPVVIARNPMALGEDALADSFLYAAPGLTNPLPMGAREPGLHPPVSNESIPQADGDGGNLIEEI